ncbi:MAG: helix-turn-helix domain-containing protein [Sandaracinaceae bacterium]
MERCSKCGHSELGGVTEDRQVEVAGYVFDVRVDAHACEQCGARYVSLPELERADLLAAAWLAEHGVREREAFRFMRKALGMRAVDLSELLDVAPETVSRWERGALPVEPRACALLGTLVCERVEGHERTLQRLRALREPPEVPAGAVRLPSEAA